MKKFIALSLLILLFGCTTVENEGQNPPPVFSTTTPPGNFTSPAENLSVDSEDDSEVEPTCFDYCGANSNESCELDISGVYPNCSCHVVCPTSDETESISDSSSNGEDDDMGVDFSDALDDALDNSKSDFYRTGPDGLFNVETYKWIKEISGGGITVDMSGEVEFNGISFTSLQSSGYVLFYDEDNHIQGIYGVSILNSTEFEDKHFGTGFDVTYHPDLLERTLIRCSVYNKEELSNIVVAYYYECENED